jgi:hypothetical protein
MAERTLQATVRSGGVVHFQFGTKGDYRKGDVTDSDLAAAIAKEICYGNGDVVSSLWGSKTRYLRLNTTEEVVKTIVGAATPGGVSMPLPEGLIA